MVPAPPLSLPTVAACNSQNDMTLGKDGFRSDMDETGFGCHLLPHFNPNTNANTNILGYEYKRIVRIWIQIQLPCRFKT